MQHRVLCVIESRKASSMICKGSTISPQDMRHLPKTKALSTEHVLNLRVRTYLDFVLHAFHNFALLPKLLYLRVQITRCDAQRDVRFLPALEGCQ